ncbi:MAG: CoA-binding protein [Candidatus Hydrogenedens sp.]|nr:CoA-binding protein [Candidatus Hydrogenedens sp.]
MLDAIFNPAAIAVYGASRNPEKVGHTVLKHLLAGGYEGRLVPINPAAEDVLDLPCYPNAAAACVPIDLAILVVPPKLVEASMREALDCGAKGIVVITAGFKETGKEGAEREIVLTALCREYGARMLGPNCLGLINTANKMNASFAPQMPERGAISVVSQSGALCTAILDLAVERGLGLAKLVSIGNKADLDESDMLEALARDPETKVIACYLESIQSGNRFIEVAERVGRDKPVVVLKAGTTQAGARAASSHTGSLAGADIAYGAAFKRAGVLRADDFESLFDISKALAMQPLPKGDRIAVITNAGGPGIIAADAIERQGMTVAKLTPAIEGKLRAALPSSASAANPIDVLGDAPPERYVTSLEAVMGDAGVDAVVVILTPQAMSLPRETARAIIETQRDGKPVLAAFMGGRDVAPARAEFLFNDLPDYTAPERAVVALRKMCDYAAWKQRPPRVVTRLPINRHRIERIIERHRRTGRVQIGEADAKKILATYHFNVPEGQLARTADDAVAVAEHVGYPVAMKIASPDIIHKSDLGGVKIGLRSASEVRDAFDLMYLRLNRAMPEAELLGAYVEAMCPPGREVILGMTRDPSFGPMLMFGLGGIFVEVMKDVSFNLAPLTHEEAAQMLEGTRSYALLRGARGQKAVDLQALAGALQTLSQLATDFPEIAEMDINPFMVGPPGARSMVADARMTLTEDERSDA